MCGSGSMSVSVVNAETIHPRQLLVRELEGLEFPVMVLRAHGKAVDVVYLDDRKVECDIPIDELSPSAGSKPPESEMEDIWCKAVGSLPSFEEPLRSSRSHESESATKEDLSTAASSSSSTSATGTPTTSMASEHDDRSAQDNASGQDDSSDESESSEDSIATDYEDDFDEDDDDNSGDEACKEDRGNAVPHDCVGAVVGSLIQKNTDEEESDEAQALEWGNHGLKLKKERKFREAEAEIRMALAIQVAVQGEKHPDAITSRNNLANVLWCQGRFAESEAEHRHALALKISKLGEGHLVVATSHHNLGLVLLRQGKVAEAGTQLRCALRIRVAELGSTSKYTLATKRSLDKAIQRENAGE